MRQFYTGLVEWSDGHLSYLRLFWSWATHIGEAIDKMLECTVQQQIENPIIRQLDPYNFTNLPDTVLTSDNGETYFSDRIYSFPTKVYYQLPYGIIASCTEGDCDINDIQVGYEVKRLSEGLIELTVVAKAENLLPLYLDLLK